MSRQIDPLERIVREFGLATVRGAPLALAGLPGRAAIGARRLRVRGLCGLTLVVDDLASAGAALAARLGTAGHAADPADLDEAGLAQVFELGECRLLLIEPGDDTDAGRFLQAHGPGIYRVTLGAPQPPAPPPAAGETDRPARRDAPREGGGLRPWPRARHPFAAD